VDDGRTVFIQLFKLSTNSNDQIEEGMDPQRFARLLSAIMVISGLLIMVIGESFDTALPYVFPYALLGIVRYFMTQAALLRGFFPVARNSIAAMTFILGATLSMVFTALFTEMSGWSWSS